MKLSVVIPVFNEKATIEKIVSLVRAVPIEKEIIIVDDGSCDGTREVLESKCQFPDTRIFLCAHNEGKGSAVRIGIQEAKGEYLVVQDADMEYNPHDILALMKKVEEPGCDVVYGSRFLSGDRVTSIWHQAVNAFLTQLCNVLYGSRLTDMETCYKLFRTSYVKSLSLESHGFEIEVELTAKVLKSKHSISEVPISYHGRSFHDGKKIGWKDGVKAVQRLFYYRFCVK